MTIRPVELVTEARGLAPLLSRCAAESLAEFRDDPLPEDFIEAFLARNFDAPETVLLVAEAEGDAPGTPGGVLLSGPSEEPLTGERQATLLLLWVRPDARHRGVARQLVEHAWRMLSGRGQRRLAARVGHNDDALISIGERWGFVRQWEWVVLE